MTLEKFEEFWNYYSSIWIESAKCDFVRDEKRVYNDISVSDLCQIKKNCAAQIYNKYKIIKQCTKEMYFKNPEKLLNRYKRAAVLTYAVMKSNPLKYKIKNHHEFEISHHKLSKQLYNLDVYCLLKERLAFFIGLSSILMDIGNEKGIHSISSPSSDPIFDFSKLGACENENNDSFLVSVYKDLFFSSIYKNYNILTMSNVYGLIVERVSKL